jgi:hypothetical protein
MADTPEIQEEEPVNEAESDPAVIIPLEAARAHLRHWWREPLAGFLSVGIGAYDSWHYGREGGLTGSLDEILIVGGIVLIAGSKRLFGPPPTGAAKIEKP